MSIAISCNSNFPSTNNIAEVGIAYSGQPVVSGDTPPDTWSISAGALPPGMSIDAVAGTITGTCQSIGTYYFTIHITDSGSHSTTVACSISVVPTKYGGTQFSPVTGFWALIGGSMEIDQGTN
jgi:hypothetical protein